MVRFYIFLVIAMAFWGSSWVSAKVLSGFITAQELIFYRYMVTSITLFPILLYLKKDFKINIYNALLALIATFFLIAYSIFFFDGAKYGTAGLGGAFVTTLNPIVTFIVVALISRKKLSKKDIFALALGAVGVMTILNIWQYSFDEIFVKANLYFVFAAFTWTFLTITNSKIKKIDHLVFSFYLYLFTTIVGYFLTNFQNGNILKFDYIFWINFLIISVGSTTFATSIYFISISKIGANKASSFIFLVPFNAIFLSYIFLDEKIYFTTIIGTIMSVIAVYILNKGKK